MDEVGLFEGIRKRMTVNRVITGESVEYPEIQPRIYREMDPESVFGAVNEVMRTLPRWRIVTCDADSRVIRAEHRTRFVGFVDDITVTISPYHERKVCVHVESVTRSGGSDMGQNAQNINELFDWLDIVIEGKVR